MSCNLSRTLNSSFSWLPAVIVGGVALAAVACSDGTEPVGAVPSDQGRQAQSEAGQPSAEDVAARRAAASGEGGAHMIDGRLAVAGMTWLAPSDWHPQAPETAFADWEYVLHGPADAEPALLTMGSIGGDMRLNFARWHGQLRLDPANVDEALRPLEGGAVPGTLYAATGIFDGKSDYMIAGFYLEHQSRPDGPGLVYVKVVGPAATVSRHLEAIERFGREAAPIAVPESAE